MHNGQQLMEGFAKQCVTEQWQGSMTLTYDMNNFLFFIIYVGRNGKYKIWDESCSENSEYFHYYGNNVLQASTVYRIWFLGVLFTAGQNISWVHCHQSARSRKDSSTKNRINCITSTWFKNIMLQSWSWIRPCNQQTNLFPLYVTRISYTNQFKQILWPKVSN